MHWLFLWLAYNKIISILLQIFLKLFVTRESKEEIMADNDQIWFDGVDKKLIAVHAESKPLAQGNDRNLVTKEALVPFSAYVRKRKREVQLLREKEAEKSVKLVKKNGTLLPQTSSRDSIRPNSRITDELAIDCEMVECYHHKSVLARVSIVNLFGHPILDRYVAPPAKVTDYRTRFSGIRKKDIEDAPSFETVQAEVASIIKDRIVVGHAIHNDFAVLKLSHPPEKTRDTSHYFKQLFQGRTPSLKKLCESVLGISIQKGEHDSVQDAQATMRLYVTVRDNWSSDVLKDSIKIVKPKPTKKQKQKPKKKKIKAFYVES